MKILKAILFCFGCFLAFLLAAGVSCALRAKYSLVPKLRTEFAYMYADNLAHYSFLQYNQAGSDQGRTALLQYLNLLQRIRNERIPYSARTLRLNFILTYLHLYRLESSAGNSTAADNYIKSAQKEWTDLGWKNEGSSIEAFKRLNQSLRTSEAQFSGKVDLSVRATQREADKARTSRR
ncbi:MAG: hypothetical protein ACYC92_13150 [Candidatus Acidiferrales bacterium]